MAERTGIGSLTAALGIALCLACFFSIPVQSQEDLKVGYAAIKGAGNSPLPVATALFSYRNQDGILVSETGVGAVEPISGGRVFVETGEIRTGLALANPSDQPLTLELALRDNHGNERNRRSLTLAAREHRARFVDEVDLFGPQPEGFTGSLTFRTKDPNQSIAAVTIRQALNAYGEPLLATLPVVALTGNRTAEVVFPHLGAGGILTTQLILINPTAETIRGGIALSTPGGLPLDLELDGESGSSFPFELKPDGVFRGTLTSSSGVFQGYAAVQVESGAPAPAGTALFQYRDGQGKLISEAGVEAIAASRTARIFVDTVGTQTGVAVANGGNPQQEVVFRLFDRNGLSMGKTSETLRSNGQLAVFVDQLFENLPPGFTGVLEIEGQEPVFPVTLKMTFNARKDPILTTLPVADLERLPEGQHLVVPQIGFGQGFSTRLIFVGINGDSLRDSQLLGDVTFFNSNGTGMVLPILGEPVNRFQYAIEAFGASQVRAGNTKTVAEILPDPTTLFSREVVVNLGNTVVVRPLVVDTSGEFRDDFRITFQSIDPDIASVDGFGAITAHQAGFSTFTVQAAGVLQTATITVVEVASGRKGFSATGIEEDLLGRLFLASPIEHQIFLADSLTDLSQAYAGVSRSAGLVNDVRQRSLFNEPRALALNRIDGSLYVADQANHVIRRIYSPESAPVITVAGNGKAGSADGVGSQARFNRPSGLAIDLRGGLWIADAGNHLIRRIDLATGKVETIAGAAGQPGFADGRKDAARFDEPTAICVQWEPLALQLAREQRGEPAPPVRVVVADTGNGALRFVSEDGAVETLVPQREGEGRVPAGVNKIGFDDPLGVAADSSGNIFVSEGSGRMTLILSTGDVVPAAQSGTFRGPSGISITESGRVMVAEAENAVSQLKFGAPEIADVQPDRVRGDGSGFITITGRNFAPDSTVALSGVLIRDVQIRDSRTIHVLVPAVPSGLGTVTIQHRGGLDQAALAVQPIPFGELPKGHVTTVAGGTTFIGDGSAATDAVIGLPTRVALDVRGNVYVVDQENHRIRRIESSAGIITSVAGTGQNGFSGDGGPAISATLNSPTGVAVDQRGNLYIADTQNLRIRRVDATGVIDTVAGVGQFAYYGDGGPATEAALSNIQGISVNAAGDIFVADQSNQRIRRIDAVSGTITTVAGSGEAGFSGDGGPATDASLLSPTGVLVDPGGDLFISDRFNNRIRKVEALTGIITTIAGTGERTFHGDGGPATEAALSNPVDLTRDSAGNLLIADRDNFRIRKIDAQTEIITTIAGNGGSGFGGDGGPATEARIRRPEGITVDGSDNLYIADSLNQRVRRIDSSRGIITTIAGRGAADAVGSGGIATEAALRQPGGVAVSQVGDLYVADTFNNLVHRIDMTVGTITAVAGNGQSGYRGDAVAATETSLSQPVSVVLDGDGTIFIADRDNNRIRKVDTETGIISTVVGTGEGAFCGDGGLAVAACIHRPEDVAVDDLGNLYVADTFNNRIRSVDSLTGVITTVAGNGDRVFSGDGGLAVRAGLNLPAAVALDKRGGLYIADQNNRIRKVDLATGTISTVVGGTNGGFSGDRGPASLAELNRPRGIAFDNSGNMYIADSLNQRIRVVEADTGIIRTLVGSGSRGSSGDGGPAIQADLNFPKAVAVDDLGNLFIADDQNHRIRAVRRPFQ